MVVPKEYLVPTNLKWSSNGELSTKEQHAALALVMAADNRPFNLTQTKPMTYVALVADSTGRFALVYGNANSWSRFIDELEDIGCEVIENQTEEYDNDIKLIREHCIPINKLLMDTDFVPFD